MACSQEENKETFYVFDDPTLMFILLGTFLAGFLPLLIMFIRCPEARAAVKCWLQGGVMIDSADDSGQEELIVARHLGEGIYLAGKNKYGKRRIFVIPRISNPFITKRFILKGIRRPIFHHYAGKTAIVNAETLAAIEVTETEKKEEIPPAVKKWAEEHHVTLPVTTVKLPSDDVMAQPQVTTKEQKIPLFNLDPRQLRYYFAEHYDESQYDVLLERARQEGYMEGRGGSAVMGKWILVIIIIAIVGVLILFVAPTILSALKGLTG